MRQSKKQMPLRNRVDKVFIVRKRADFDKGDLKLKVKFKEKV